MPDFDFAAAVAAGYVFTPDGAAWNVTAPDGRHGYGPTPEDAQQNIGATVLPTEYGRVLTRESGEQIYLDPSLAPVADEVPAPETV